MIVPIFPESNCLRFVQTNPIIEGNTTFSNRLYSDEYFENINGFLPYVQKYAIGDKIVIQFRASHATITCKVFNYNYTEVANITPTQVYDTTAYKIYNCEIDTSLLGGNYYVQFQFTETGIQPYEYSSEWFNVSEKNKQLPLIQWQTMYSDGIYYTGIELFGFRIEASVNECVMGSKLTAFTSYNNQLLNTAATVQRAFKFATDVLPRFIIEKLTWALVHEDLFVNGVKYTAKDEPKSNEEEKSNLYKLECTLQELEYANYFKTEAVAQQDTESVTVFSFDGLTDAIGIDENTVLKAYNNY